MTGEVRDAADIERRVREAAPQAEPDYWPLIGDLIVLFGESRSTVHNWLTKGVRFGRRRIAIRYRLSLGGYRMAHPADVAMVLDETRKVRSVIYPDGVPAPVAGTCPTCGQVLPSA